MITSSTKRHGGRPRPATGFRLLAATLALTLLAAGCEGKRHRYDPSKPPLVGFSMDSLVVERWQRDLAVFERTLGELGAGFVLRVAGQDAGVQERQLGELAGLGIDVLVIVPNDADRLSAAVAGIRARGIPVLSYDRLVRKAGVELYVSFDNEKVGMLMAEAAIRNLPSPGGCLILNGARNDNNALLLNRGMHAVLDPLVASGGIRIVSETWPESWDSEEGRRGLEAAVAAGGDFSAVIAGNDMLAEAAIAVLAEGRLAGGVAVVGQDAELSACQRIAEGSQYATVYKPIDRLAREAAALAVKLAKGESIEADSTIDDGAGRVPFVRLEPILVTRELLDSTVIKDGFHGAAEVYRNLRR